MQRKNTPYRIATTWLLLVCTLCFGCRQQSTQKQAARPSREADVDPLVLAEQFYRQGKFKQAIAKAEDVFGRDPSDATALSLLVQLHSELGNKREAAKHGETLANIRPDLGPTIVAQIFTWYIELGEFDAAERVARQAIESDRTNINGHRVLAQLLCAQGRRLEAREPLLELIRLSSATPQELFALVDLSNPCRIVSFDEFRLTPKSDLFQLGEARRAQAENEDVADVLVKTRRVREQFPECLDGIAFEGRLLIESGRVAEFENWLRECPPNIEEHADFWRAAGLYLQLTSQYRKAIRSYGEAICINPTDRQVLRGLAECLEAINESDQAAAVRETLSKLERIFRISGDADAQECEEIALALQELSRPLESTAWLMQAKQMEGTMDRFGQQFAARIETIQQWEKNATPKERRRMNLQQAVGLKLDDFPLFDRLAGNKIDPESREPAHPNDIRFREVAGLTGLRAANPIVVPMEAKHIPYLYQTTGSGVGVIDFDLDGQPDVYESVATTAPLKKSPKSANRLFRNLQDAGSFSDATTYARVGDESFGQGVCVGDINQDGFPDLIVANFGKNRVYQNQGDGSFTERDVGFDNAWTSSIALADVTGDHLPDIFQIEYVDDPAAPTRECHFGNNCTPQQMDPAIDAVYTCQTNGSFVRLQSERLAAKPNYGLGVVVADFDSKPGNEVFIANDADLNHFWSGSSGSSPSEDPFSLVETATIRGCAVGRNGLSQACMGIAAGDFNLDGKIDLHVTNFLNEPCNLFVQTTPGMFSDETIRYGLLDPSIKGLGFGSQARDFDNDGWLDIVVLNGHVFGDSTEGTPFRMRPQLFRGRSNGFRLQLANQDDDYFAARSLGRSLAVADMNQDGRMDLLASHLDRPVALLENSSDTSGSWIQFQLQGIESERDAVGTRVAVRSNDRVFYAWRTAGDGYMCANEAMLHIGLGSIGEDEVVSVELDWPSGSRQKLEGLAANKRYLIVEDTAMPFEYR